MEQNTTSTYPQWVEDMHKWQQENNEHRAVFCIATDYSDSYNTLYGCNLALQTALLAVMIENPDYMEICEGALIAKKNPIAALALMEALKYSKGTGETPTENKEDGFDDASIKQSLKTILSKIADKL